MKHFLALLLALMIPAVAQARTGTPKQEDLQRLFARLVQRHPRLYAHITPEDLQEKREGFALAVDSMTDVELYYALVELLASIGDAHTGLRWTDGADRHLTALPFSLARIDGRWRLTACLPEYADRLGWEILAMDGVPTEHVFESAKRIISYETEPWAAEKFPDAIRYLESLQYLGITPQDAEGVSLTLRSPDGKEISVTLTGIPPTEPAPALVTLGVAAPTTAPSGYYCAMPLDEKTLYIQYNTCEEDPVLPTSVFAETVRGMLEEGRYVKAALDLRYNTGGNSTIWYPLRDVLLDHQQSSGLTVYTLIGGKTYSSA